MTFLLCIRYNIRVNACGVPLFDVLTAPGNPLQPFLLIYII